MKLWGGRFEGNTDPLMERFSASIEFDKALYEQDIAGSIAHAKMLARIGILTTEEKNNIVRGLKEIEVDIRNGRFEFSQTLEDIHMHIETALINKIGAAGKKLHTGRSRNDQVSVDMRMFLKKELGIIDERLLEMLKSIVLRASKDGRIMMPGYTHLQRAQAVPFGHYILAFYQMLKRDRIRLKETLARVDILPLGSGALAGSTIALDRKYVAKQLGFAGVSTNSMDAVADRDFVIDALYACAMIMLHLSRLCEDLILFATEEFSFISLPDALCTGSSLMPHKKNPDALELTRGKTSRVLGDLFSMFSLMKGLPLTYNRDLQEDKEPLFHGVSTAKDALSIMRLCVEEMRLNEENMQKAVGTSFMPAVEMAEYLTARGIPFREAHGVVGKIVHECEIKGKLLHQLSLTDLRKYSDSFGEDVFDFIEAKNALNKRKTTGGASYAELNRQINEESKYLNL